jgi:hypothetical protein
VYGARRHRLFHAATEFSASPRSFPGRHGVFPAATAPVHAATVSAHVSGYERGEREPSLPALLRYARLAGVCLDAIVDDALDLPAKLPAKPKHS